MTGTGVAGSVSTAAAGGVADFIQRGIRLFAHDRDQPRARRATDVILLALSVVAVGVIGVVAEPEPGYLDAVANAFLALPAALDGVFRALADLPLIWAAVLLVASIARRRGPIARDMIAAIVLSIVVWMLLGRVVVGDWPALDLAGHGSPPPVFPAGRVAIPGAALITASPHLVRPARRLGRWLLTLASFAVLAIGSSTVTGVAAGLMVATAAAAAVHLAVGSSAGRPSLDDVRYALADLRVPTTSVGVAARQPAGQFAVAATGLDGEELVVKLYGRDAHDAAVLSTVQRTVWLRRPGSPVGFGRLRQVEHEALLTLLASQAGVSTDTVVTAGVTSSDDAVLVLRRYGRPLVEPDRIVTPDTPPDERFTGDGGPVALRQLWELVDTLHAAGVAHGAIDEDHLLDVDGGFGLVDFRGASVAATVDQMRSDDAQMFVATVVLAGRSAAIAAFVANRSNEEIDAILPYLQSVVLTADQRRVTRRLDLDLDDIRAEVAIAIGVEAPQLVQLRRFSVGSVIRIALPLLAVFMLVSALSGFDLAEFAESLQDANWWLVVLGFVIAQTPRVAQAVATLGAAPIALPLGPVYALQLAISYVNLAIPTAAARIAVNVRFFQRQGVPAGAAIATGALDGVSGFIVQAMLLVGLLVLTPMSLDLDLGDSTNDAARLIVVILAIVVVAGIVVASIPRLRRFLVDRIRRIAREAFGVLRGLHSPRRLVMLFGGNLVAELLFATALGIFTRAFGFPVPFEELLFINMCVSLLSGLIPVPGGIGVTEGGLIYGLTAVGVTQEAAFAAVILYRLATFYLPPIWGFFSLRWLERNTYL